ncbi:tRNA-2-methylthio-N(6)-dimethylallyladenosine synthase MiaB [Anaerosporomusa subterranea]|uniref:tRNA-2-methylthio-N(6)-dimethylallyladenosine synthase n=1 Tax=Anaerosporomusa subterranea TaxID=1794912 RepID=A0A154BT95_ANASB|nr:tRNA (N6-isopentenyl adenosine(37)-C2)-methylthiotransferase MiaB [Anaerosporomusa subterranea]KYZ77141.1 tRNA-2-methylthio-N(6)-dimethylallyladenosine synthase MiaB [Anaerosporomusa subterranea]
MQGHQTYYIYTFGCQANAADSEQLAAQLQQAGYTATLLPDEADLIVLNTCCVRESAERKIYGKIGELKKLKTADPNRIIGVAGCLAQKDKDKLFAKAPHLDFVMGTFTVGRLLENINKVKENREQVLSVWEQAEETQRLRPASLSGQISAWVPIMYGCNNFCTYCIVPYVRGRERSRPVTEIIQEIAALAKQGVKEVTLLGQNVNSYGKDGQANATFADLLREADKIKEIQRIRYMTSHPRDMNQQVVDVVRNSRSICEHFHLPVQSGNDRILQAMNRGYSINDYRTLVRSIRQAIPDSSLTTDLIVGFPGETDELFAQTLDFIREIRFDAAYTFLYSPRSGTPAATMPEQIPSLIKKQRLQLLMDVQNEISLQINRQLEGKIVEVLVEGPSKNDDSAFVGRTRTNKIVIWKHTGSEQAGELLSVQIDKAQTWVLKGKAVD